MNESQSNQRSSEPAQRRRYLLATLVLLLVLVTAALVAGVRFEDGTIGAMGIFIIALVGATGYATDFVRRRFQLGLKSMLVVVTIFAAIFGLFGAGAYQARKQRAVVKVILRDGGRVQYDFTEPGRSSWIVTRRGLLAPRWMKSWLGDDMFGKITSAYLGPDTRSEFIPRLRIKGLTTIALHRIPSVSAELARNLGGLSQLKTLNVGFTPFTDDHVKEISNLQLTSLNLNSTFVTHNGIKHLYQMKTLRHLGLARLKLTDRDVAMLEEKLPHAKVLVNPIATKGWTVKQIQALRKLALNRSIHFDVHFGYLSDPRQKKTHGRDLSVKGMEIEFSEDSASLSPEVVNQLNQLPHVHTLHILGATVQEVKLVAAQMKSLRRFVFRIKTNPTVVRNVVKQVRKALPQCRVESW